jgi:predicted RNase H-like HicB family nuclease
VPGSFQGEEGGNERSSSTGREGVLGGAWTAPPPGWSEGRYATIARVTHDFILSGYIDEALGKAVYDKLEDGSFAGKIPPCPGVVAFGATLVGCERELRSTLEDWILVGLKLGHPLPVLAGIDLSRRPNLATMGAL